MLWGKWSLGNAEFKRTRDSEVRGERDVSDGIGIRRIRSSGMRNVRRVGDVDFFCFPNISCNTAAFGFVFRQFFFSLFIGVFRFFSFYCCYCCWKRQIENGETQDDSE